MVVAALHRTPSVAALAAEFACAAAEHYRSGAFPFTNFKLLHKAGLLALTVPIHLGGNAAGLAEAARLVGTIATGEPSTALASAMESTHHALIARSTRFPRHRPSAWGCEAASAVRCSTRCGSSPSWARQRVAVCLRPPPRARHKVGGSSGTRSTPPAYRSWLVSGLGQDGRGRATRRPFPGACRSARDPDRRELGSLGHAGPPGSHDIVSTAWRSRPITRSTSVHPATGRSSPRPGPGTRC